MHGVAIKCLYEMHGVTIKYLYEMHGATIKIAYINLSFIRDSWFYL